MMIDLRNSWLTLRPYHQSFFAGRSSSRPYREGELVTEALQIWTKIKTRFGRAIRFTLMEFKVVLIQIFTDAFQSSQRHIKWRIFFKSKAMTNYINYK